MAKTFDFIIVGGGTAGLVLANRLTETSGIEVVVIEAGANRLNDPKITIPGLATTLYDDPLYDWSFTTVPQENLNGKRVRHGRGKVLGGSSAINVLGLVYPSKASIDAWAKLGNEGWDWAGLEPYYKKFNTYNPPSADTAKSLQTSYVDVSIQGTSGPIHGCFPEFHGPLGGAWVETFKNLGLPNTGDPLSGTSLGGLNSLSTINPKTWERSHAGNGYYAPVADRPNLHVITECVVEKLALERSSTNEISATGVYIAHDGKSELLTAKKEVLLCAGVFQSTQLLELSGIGNPEVLRKHNIDVVVENVHVGENLQDHAMTGLSFEVVDGLPTIDMIRDPQVVQDAMTAYITSRQGPLTSSFHSFATVPVVEALVEPGHSEVLKLLEKHFATVQNPNALSEASQFAAIRSILENPNEGSAFMAMGAAQLHFNATTQKDVFAISDPLNYMSFLVALSYPLSRGTVHITSSSVHDLPAVDPNYFSHPLDFEILGRHMQWVPKIASTKPLADFLKPNGSKLPKGADLSTLEAVKEHIRNNVITYNHPCGTCAMMPKELGGVVDNRLKVYGVKGLRVVDASIFPIIPKVNIQSTVYAMAEKAADLIKEDYAIEKQAQDIGGHTMIG
ncbi:hypothetical protein MMC17_009080 [Xylographa soralifera]|nr:hypothetical protein [Xylographa soralifera]